LNDQLSGQLSDHLVVTIGSDRVSGSREHVCGAVRVRLIEPYRFSHQGHTELGLKLGAALNELRPQVAPRGWRHFVSERLGINYKTAERWMNKAAGRRPIPNPKLSLTNAGTNNTERKSETGQGVPLAGSVGGFDIDDGSDDPLLPDFDESELADCEEPEDDLYDEYDAEDAEDEGQGGEEAIDDGGPEDGRDRDAAPAAPASAPCDGLSVTDWASDAKPDPVADVRRVVAAANEWQHGSAAKVGGPADHATHATGVQLTLAVEYERVRDEERELASLVDRVIVSARGGVLSNRVVGQMRNVLEEARRQINFLVETEAESHHRDQGGSPAAPAALAAVG
jgi:hypothetical protein